ncbi:hypothetical protein F2Q69_00022966 [Brassica cretica]|uniref:Uncharacterized protein n=1 Tax=Brassica cretica TaxID=69181 RepID=A0A8S9QNM9_BRACR|nr:hypothetical protein F2Q69_00022966 [Brassica cretica]
MATQQMRRLQYRNVAFISDCKKLIDELHQCLAGKTITKARHTEWINPNQTITPSSSPFGESTQHFPAISPSSAVTLSISSPLAATLSIASSSAFVLCITVDSELCMLRFDWSMGCDCSRLRAVPLAEKRDQIELLLLL